MGAAALGDAGLAAAQEPLKIGIIGTGYIGGALARHWVNAGHEVFMSSRHPEELAAAPRRSSAFARTSALRREAAAFGSRRARVRAVWRGAADRRPTSRPSSPAKSSSIRAIPSIGARARKRSSGNGRAPDCRRPSS